jgi:hypothetical protein
LLDQGVLSDQDVEQFETPLPYARLNRLISVLNPSGQYIERMSSVGSATLLLGHAFSKFKGYVARNDRNLVIDNFCFIMSADKW